MADRRGTEGGRARLSRHGSRIAGTTVLRRFGGKRTWRPIFPARGRRASEDHATALPRRLHDHGDRRRLVGCRRVDLRPGIVPPDPGLYRQPESRPRLGAGAGPSLRPERNPARKHRARPSHPDQIADRAGVRLHLLQGNGCRDRSAAGHRGKTRRTLTAWDC
jgi:hypothetical protein